MTGGKDWLPLLVKTNVRAIDIAITAEDGLFFRLPDDELHIGLLHIVVMIDITFETRAASGFAEDDFTQSAHFAHQVGTLVAIEDIDVGTTFA